MKLLALVLLIAAPIMACVFAICEYIARRMVKKYREEGYRGENK